MEPCDVFTTSSNVASPVIGSASIAHLEVEKSFKTSHRQRLLLLLLLEVSECHFLWSLGPRRFWLLDVWTPPLACLVCGVTRQACPPQRIETTHRCAPSKSSGCSITHSKHYYFMFFPFLLAPYCSVEAFSKSERKILTKADTKICLSLSFG